MSYTQGSHSWNKQRLYLYKEKTNFLDTPTFATTRLSWTARSACTAISILVRKRGMDAHTSFYYSSARLYCFKKRCGLPLVMVEKVVM